MTTTLTAVELTLYLQSLAALPAQQLYTVGDDGAVIPLTKVEMSALVTKLGFSKNLRMDIDCIVPEMLHWARIAALQRHAAMVAERDLRIWKATKELEIRAAAKAANEKMTEGLVEAGYRVLPDYRRLNSLAESAEAANAFAEAVARTLRAKHELLLADVRRTPEGALQRIS